MKEMWIGLNLNFNMKLIKNNIQKKHHRKSYNNDLRFAKTLLLILSLFLLSMGLMAQQPLNDSPDEMYIVVADGIKPTEYDTLNFLHGTSERIIDSINVYRRYKELPKFEIGYKYDVEIDTFYLDNFYDMEEELVYYVDSKKIHRLFYYENDYCECDDYYYNELMGDKKFKRWVSNGEYEKLAVMFVHSSKDSYMRISIQHENGKINTRFYKFLDEE